MKYFFSVILLHLVVATPHINLYFTDGFSTNHGIQHDCLRVAAAVDHSNINRQMIFYCLGESLSKYNFETHHHSSKFTFADLAQQSITSTQLYLWSAPMDIVEEYQFYLDQRSTSTGRLLQNTLFYNCTLPRFGSICQYQFDYYHPNHVSLYHIIHDLYQSSTYNPVEFTCYTHLQCDRGPNSSCLDWSEICDGKLDCRDGGLDEEHCWQLEVNECKENEYRCMNGQCIPQAFYLDDSITPDCLDQSDERRSRLYLGQKCHGTEPSVMCVDITCSDMPLTSSCLPQRTNLLVQALFSVKDANVSNDCWSAFKCVLDAPQSEDPACRNLCESQSYISIIDRTCPEMVFIPAVPVLSNNIYFAYTKNDSIHLDCGKYRVPYKCSNTTRYGHLFLDSSEIIFNNRTCFRSTDFDETFGILISPWMYSYVIPAYLALQKYILISNYSSEICNRSNMYQCIHSPKCISIHRLMNGIEDCPSGDDEDITKNNDTNAIKQMKQNSFKCQVKNKYVSFTSVEDGKCDCGYVNPYWCEDEDLETNLARRNISFQTICDGYTELLPILIDQRNETDETECEQWMCDNIYTRCDGLWNCRNGEDETGCYKPASLTCSFNEHLCVSSRTYQLICLPIDKVNDGRIDCIGATDERNFCHSKEAISQTNNFYCLTNKSSNCLNVHSLCDMRDHCLDRDDEQFCNKNQSHRIGNSICQTSFSSNRTDVEEFLCDYSKGKVKQQTIYFTFDKIENFLEDQTNDDIKSAVLPSKSWINQSQLQNLRCHHGLDLRIWNKNVTNIICLCPPSYYGDRCQYQNERISLSIQFRVSSHSRQIPFAILISLVDHSDQRIIHSYEQFTYLSVRDCKIKFSIYLLYSLRPKDSTKQYAIQIDIYEKISLDYRGSLLLPMTFPFLPVHRLAFIVDIPRNNDTITTCSIDQCQHGKCIRYSHNPQNTTFCQCHPGWSGRSCTISHRCRCSSEALCIGMDANNRSICICSLHRFGSRCFLDHTSCSINGNRTCQNGGQCIPNDEYIESNEKFTCICPKGYIGKRCETIENQILLSFGNDLVLPQSIFVHFIQVINDDQPRRATTFRTIPFQKDSIVIHWSQPFHLVFMEFPNQNYYLSVRQNTYNRSAIIRTTINSSHRCRHITELFNITIVQLPLIRRIKYYQLPCQANARNLSCFYDDIHLCLCEDHRRQRVANCFQFNHNMTFNCRGQSVCENGAQCFQDAPDCPQRSICICPACYYGTQCQFTTSRFSLSLDGILGYHIQPNLRITQQPSIVQISVALTIIFILVGLVNSILTLITFKNKGVRNVGCGYYLFSSSISTLLTTIFFGLKFWILLLAQMNIIENRSFLLFQCHSIDFLLRSSFNMTQWLNASVAIERAMTMVKGALFNKAKSKRTAKFVILILLILTIGTYLDDPIYRRLIDEENEDEKRIWCVVSYSSFFLTFNTVKNIFYFLAPFLINLISAIILITQKSRQKAELHNDRNYNHHLRKEIREYKHLLIAPVILVILALPHLIFSFASKCMKSNHSSWLFLIGYFISFIPPMLTFVIFILPSKFYKKQLHTTVTRYRTNVKRRVNAMGFRSTI